MTSIDPDLPHLRRKAQAGVRRKPLFWHDDGVGWHHELGYADEWEVICPCMGDNRGPEYLQGDACVCFPGPCVPNRRLGQLLMSKRREPLDLT